MTGAEQAAAPFLTRIVHRRVFNCYLVVEDDGLTLIDTGPAGATKAVLDEIGTVGAPLRRIFLTHAHNDHVAGLDSIARAVGGDLEVVIGSREAALLDGDFSVRDDEPGPDSRRGYGQPSTRPTRLVDDGDRVGSLRVIATPGHSPGHLSLIDERDGTLIAGDAVTTLGRVAVSGDLVLRWPFPACATWNKPPAAKSARRLIEEEPTRLASGHGPVVGDGVAALARALERAD